MTRPEGTVEIAFRPRHVGLEFQALFLDAMNTKGFSGGPFFAVIGTVPVLAGIMSSYKHRKVRLSIDGHPGLVELEENVGIAIAYSIEGVIAAIQKQFK